MRIKQWLSSFLLFFQFVSFAKAPAQSQKFEYLSPIPNSTLVSRSSSIIIRQGAFVDQNSLANSNGITVVGSRSGAHRGSIFLAADGKTIVYSPQNAFFPGENVTVRIGSGVESRSGENFRPYEFAFTVSPLKSAPNMNVMERLKDQASQMNASVIGGAQSAEKPLSTPMTRFLPTDFPGISVTTSGSTAPGDVFLSNFAFDQSISNSPYLMILNNNGEPVFYKQMQVICLDFKIQPTGQVTYFDGSAGKYMVADNAFNILDSYGTGNGYVTDLHEFRLMPNGHALMLAYDPEPVRMDTIVPGGKAAATVTGLIVQEVDEQKNVVFQWRSWDHYAITDSYEDLTQQAIDYVHGNALEIDYDGNILLSARHLCEVTKINRQTGAIIWRLGGKNNQFTFINDSTGFSFQHSVRRLENGDLVVFDNGNGRTPPYSRAAEYRLDENAKTATLVWQYRNSPDYYGSAMGYVQRFSNSNTLIGWGATNPSVTEVTASGSKLFEMTLPTGIFSYRAYRFPWKDGILSIGIDTLDFGAASFQAGSTKQLVIRNLTQKSQSITAFATRDSEFTVLASVPIVIPAEDTVSVPVMFLPTHYGAVADVLDVRSDSAGEGIVEQVVLEGESAPPSIATSVTEMDFGNVAGGYSSTISMRISNTSKNHLVIDSIYTRNRIFTVGPNQMQVSDTASVRVSFAPTVQGSFTDVLYLVNNSTTPILRIPIYGTSYGLPIEDEQYVEFGPNPVQDSVVTSIWIHDTLASPIAVVNALGVNGTFFPEEKFPINVPGHDSVKVELGFNPPGFGQYRDTLLFVSDSSDIATIVVGSSPPPVLLSSTRVLDFGTTTVDSAKSGTIVFRDSSINVLRIDSLYTKSKVFSIIPTRMPVYVRQGDTSSFEVRFAPDATGTFSDTLFAASNSEQMIAKIAVQGVGSLITSESEADLIPKTFTLGQNYPNPFNPTTTIPFGVPTLSSVRIRVYNVLGQSIANLVNEEFKPGFYSVTWNGHAPSGVYLYTLEATPTSETKPNIFRVRKMLLLK